MDSLPTNRLDEIYPNLWLGGITAAESAEILESFAITDIISITSHRPKIPKGLNIRKKHFRLRDNTTADLLSILPECISLLESILSEEDGGIDELGRQRKVLVHCRMGMSRSGGIVVAYAMKYAQIPASLALEYVRSRRPIVHPNRAFMAQLTVWGECGYDTSLLIPDDDAEGPLLQDPDGDAAGAIRPGEDGCSRIEAVEDQEEDEEELLRKALEMSLLPEENLDESSGGDGMDWVEAEVEVETGLIGAERVGEGSEKQAATLPGTHEGTQDTEMEEDVPLLGSIDGGDVPHRRDIIQDQVMSSETAGDLILPKSLPTQLGVIPPADMYGEAGPCLENPIGEEGITPVGLQNLYPEQRQRGEAEALSPSLEGGWAEVVMGDVMKRCFEECVRDINKELGLGWPITTSN